MSELFNRGGLIMWLLLIISAVIFGLAIKTIIELARDKHPNPRLETGLNSILFWGVTCAMIGILGHFIGIYNAMLNILRINDTSPAIVGSEYFMSFATITFGLFIFMITAIIWFVLRWWYRKIMQGGEK